MRIWTSTNFACSRNFRVTIRGSRTSDGIDIVLSKNIVSVRFDNESVKNDIAKCANEFYREFSNKKNKLPNGAYLVFMPKNETINRYNGNKSLAWAEYAIHNVTNDRIDRNGKHERVFNSKKVSVVNKIIDKIVSNNQVKKEDNGNVRFFKKLNENRVGIVVARPLDDGNYIADLVEVTTSYASRKLPANLKPLDRVSEVNTSERGSSFTSADGGIVSQHSDAVNGLKRSSGLLDDLDLPDPTGGYRGGVNLNVFDSKPARGVASP